MKVHFLLTILQLESIWILTNLAYGTEEDTAKIIQHPMDVLNAVTGILADGKDLVMVEQSLWLIGNLIGDSAPLSEVVLQRTGVLEAMIKLTKSTRISRTLLRTICWVNSNLSRHKKMNSDQVSSSHPHSFFSATRVSPSQGRGFLPRMTPWCPIACGPSTTLQIQVTMQPSELLPRAMSCIKSARRLALRTQSCMCQPLRRLAVSSQRMRRRSSTAAYGVSASRSSPTSWRTIRRSLMAS